jgi:hypothetical protein
MALSFGHFYIHSAFGKMGTCSLVRVGDVESSERLACFLGESESGCFLTD